MSITGAIVLFAVFWFLSLYLILPLFVRSQDEAGEVEPGTPASAPDRPLMGKKLLWATGCAVVAWLVAFGIIEGGLVSIADLRAISGAPER